MDFRHLGAVWERLAVARHAVLVGVNHHGISHDHSDFASVLTDRDYWPVFVSVELRECETIRHFDGVLVLSGNRHTDSQDDDGYRNMTLIRLLSFNCTSSFEFCCVNGRASQDDEHCRGYRNRELVLALHD
jgi:hypothetical protein